MSAEPPDAFSVKEPTAIKEHTCCECRGTIRIGEKYHLFSGVWDGEAYTFKTCAECEQLRNDICATIRDRDEYPPFQHLYEHVFESRDTQWVSRFMDTRRKRNSPESPNGWMEKREKELKAPPPKKEEPKTMNIKCIVAATNSNGDPDLFFVIVSCTQEQQEEGEHYEVAKGAAEKQGYEPYLAYDENDSAGRAMLPLFAWESASVVEIPPKPKD